MVWRSLIELKIELPYDSVIPLLGIFPEKTIIPKKKKYMHLNVHRSTVYISQDTEANQVYTDRLMD